MQRHLELMRDRAAVLPLPSDPMTYGSARIWHCKYETLGPIAALLNLKTLHIASYPDATFEPLAALRGLETLYVLHLPSIHNLAALAALSNLRELHLATLPSWDSSGKVTTVESLLPLVNLPKLEHLELFGVVTPSRSADELLSSASLKLVKLSKYAPDSMDRVGQRYAA
jgi:hypothetical protein